MAPKGFVAHDHPALVHRHEHVHVTHYAHTGKRGVEHLTCTHRHEHNHAPVQHAHAPHEDVEREHRREAHVHNHEHPTEDR